MKSLHWSLVLVPIAVGACDSQGSAPSGDGIALKVAPLQLLGLKGACYDVAVYNGPGGKTHVVGTQTVTNDTVWSKGNPGHQAGTDGIAGTTDDALLAADADAICSTQYGNGDKADVTYIGTCDAGPNGSQMNSVTLWFDGLYDPQGNYMPPGGNNGWQNPCVNGCTLDVLCKENTDTEVLFNFTVLRDAQQGFFDVAVNFRDIFCSAKYDTCYDLDPTPNDGKDDAKHIELLFGDGVGDGPGRDETGVLAVACTGGVDGIPTPNGTATPAPKPSTILSYSAVTLSCSKDGLVTETFDLDLSRGRPDDQGNQTAIGSAGTKLEYGLYFGQEQLTCDKAGTDAVERCNKEYLNIAIDLEDLPAGTVCTLKAQATAEPSNGVTLVNGQLGGTGMTQPYINVDITNARACQKNPLNHGGGVNTLYGSTFIGGIRPKTMCYKYMGEPEVETSVAPTVEDYTYIVPFATKDKAELLGVINLPRLGANGREQATTTYPRELKLEAFGELLNRECNTAVTLPVRKDVAYIRVNLDGVASEKHVLVLSKAGELPSGDWTKVTKVYAFGVKGGETTQLGEAVTLDQVAAKLATTEGYRLQLGGYSGVVFGLERIGEWKDVAAAGYDIAFIATIIAQ